MCPASFSATKFSCWFLTHYWGWNCCVLLWVISWAPHIWKPNHSRRRAKSASKSWKHPYWWKSRWALTSTKSQTAPCFIAWHCLGLPYQVHSFLSPYLWLHHPCEKSSVFDSPVRFADKWFNATFLRLAQIYTRESNYESNSRVLCNAYICIWRAQLWDVESLCFGGVWD